MSKPPMTAPVIIAEGIDDYILESGNTIPKKTYDAMWNPKKGVVIPFRHSNYDGRQIKSELKLKKR